MLRAALRRLWRLIARKSELLPGGFSWPVVVSVDIVLVVMGAVAGLQRPMSEWWIAVIAFAVACLPWAFYLTFDVLIYEAFALWLAWTGAVAILLFGTSTPIEGDFAPAVLSLLTGVVGAVASLRGGILAAAGGIALLCVAAATHRIETPVLYLVMIGIGWLVGYLMRVQQQLLIQQREAQDKLADHAVADERRRIAREIHDVIAHSLSVTLLHVTGARRGLQQDRDIDEAVEALEQAERLGRQAMADIRSTVGLLDDAVGKVAPEPGIGDIPALVDDFIGAGLAVRFESSGRHDGISAAVGLALYRIAQESLANIAKHAPDSPSTMTLTVSPVTAALTVSNSLPVPAAVGYGTDGHGMRGMRQRVDLLGGSVSAGPAGDSWVVHALIPLDGGPCVLRGWGP